MHLLKRTLQTETYLLDYRLNKLIKSPSQLINKTWHLKLSEHISLVPCVGNDKDLCQFTALVFCPMTIISRTWVRSIILESMSMMFWCSRAPLMNSSSVNSPSGRKIPAINEQSSSFHLDITTHSCGQCFWTAVPSNSLDIGGFSVNMWAMC